MEYLSSGHCGHHMIWLNDSEVTLKGMGKLDYNQTQQNAKRIGFNNLYWIATMRSNIQSELLRVQHLMSLIPLRRGVIS